VLDLTRVIAGPVCTRYLGALGADVLRIDPPDVLDLRPGSAADTLLGKRSTFLDLAPADGQATLHHLLDGADVVVHGYRPGALERFGLGSADLAARHAGLVVVELDAWGHSGPWSGRRGFDSIVQVACGIATIESPDGSTPGALPCQLLDHGTGYLAAAAVLDGLRRQALEGGTILRSLSLAGTAAWLTGLSTGSMTAPAEGRSPEDGTGQLTGDEWMIQIDGPVGSIFAVAPPGALDGRPLEWAGGLAAYGADSPEWGQTR
jgi:crotonobetainyl-CoA:carnitine CoA-transferase CaiB-like acyl-CoA transferase